MFDTSRFVFPLFSAIREPNMVRIQRFLGCGFWLDEHGHFATCRHVLELIPSDQVPVVGQLGSDFFYKVHESIAHSKFDMAVGLSVPKAVGGVLPHYSGALGLGLDVQAFGYTDSGKQGSKYQVDPRLLRGHVSRVTEEGYGLPAASLLEVSFGSPSGFSGTPLLVGTEVVGMLFNNIDSRLQAYSIHETVDGNSEFRETAYRIYEYGVAHKLMDMKDFFLECGVGTSSGA
jgi:hypothetical protein